MVLDHLYHLFWRRFFVSHDLERHDVGTYFRLIRVCLFLITYLKDHHLYQKDKSFRNLAAMYKGRWSPFFIISLLSPILPSPHRSPSVTARSSIILPDPLNNILSQDLAAVVLANHKALLSLEVLCVKELRMTQLKRRLIAPWDD